VADGYRRFETAAGAEKTVSRREGENSSACPPGDGLQQVDAKKSNVRRVRDLAGRARSAARSDRPAPASAQLAVLAPTRAGSVGIDDDCTGRSAPK
jgi:hypothetical protein